MNYETLPYDDKNMIWDNDDQRYILTCDSDTRIKKVYSQDLGVINAKLNETSLLIYTFIFTRTHRANVLFFKKLLATDKRYRKVIKDAMLEQLRADMESGYNDLHRQIPLNLQSFLSKDRDFFTRNMICPMAENILSQATPFNLLYCGDYGVREEDKEYFKKVDIKKADDYDEYRELTETEISEIIDTNWEEN